MVLHVSRRYEPMNTVDSPWMESAFDRIVWKLDADTGVVTIPADPFSHKRHYRGLLRCYIDDTVATIEQFDTMLIGANTGWTRQQIEKVIHL